MDINIDQKTWDFLAKKTNDCPIFSEAVFHKSTGDKFFMTQTRKSFRDCFWFISLGSLFIYFGLTKNFYVLGNMACLLLGCILIHICLRPLININKVSWNPLSDSVIIRYGNIFSKHNFILNKNKMISVLYLCDETKAQECKSLKSKYILSLKLLNEGLSEIKIAQAYSDSEIRYLFQSLKTYLGVETLDETQEEIELPDGEMLRASKSVLEFNPGILVNASLSFSSPEIAVFRYSLMKSITTYLIFLIILIGIYGTITYFADLSLPGMLFVITCVLPLVHLALHSIYIHLKRPRVIADRSMKILNIKLPTIKHDENIASTNQFSFDNIASFQLCGKNPGQEKDDYAEFNVILGKPPGKRLNIASNTRESVLRPQAEKFAEFVGKPLIDHIKSG